MKAAEPLFLNRVNAVQEMRGDHGHSALQDLIDINEAAVIADILFKMH